MQTPKVLFSPLMNTESPEPDQRPDEMVSRKDLQRLRLQMMVFLFVLSVLSFYPGNSLAEGWARWGFQLALLLWGVVGFRP